MKMLIMRGLPGSGKSTWANEYLEQYRLIRPTAYVNKDSIRASMSPNHEEIDEYKVHFRMLELIAQGIHDNVDILVDNMNLKDRDIRQLTKIADEAGYHVEIYDFRDVPLEVCLDRNSKRGRVVPEDVIRKYHEKYIKGKI